MRVIYTVHSAAASFYTIKVLKGDIFDALEIWDQWVQVHLCSGDQRYIKRSTVKAVHEVPSLDLDLLSFAYPLLTLGSNAAHKVIMV